jgi:cobalamin biosynthesis protein CobT
MDDAELYRWGLGDLRVFSERVIEAKPDVFIGLLCDVSGSTYGPKLTIIQRLAQLLVWATADMEGVETAVWAHTGDSGDDQSVDIYRVWEHGDPLTRLGLLEELPHANNYDGHAAAYVVSQMATHPQPAKSLFVLSDGLPSGTRYGGRPAQQHVCAVSDWARRQGVDVFQIAIDPYDLRMQDQVAMYGAGNVLPFQSYASLQRQMTALMSRYL